MNFNQTEQYVLAMLGIGMLNAGYQEGHISERQLMQYCEEACAKLGTTLNSVYSKKIEVNAFLVIRQMDSQKKNFAKSFLYEMSQKVPKCETAVYYFVTTLEEGGLINIDI